MTAQTFFEQIKGKKIDITRLNPDPGCSSTSSNPSGWYYITHKYTINPDNTITCVPIDGIIAYGDEDDTHMYSIAIFINGFFTDKTCCTSNPVTTNTCTSGEMLEPCVAFSRINKSTAQIDENIPIEIENKALSTLPFGSGIGDIIGSNILYIGIGIGLITLAYIVTKK